MCAACNAKVARITVQNSIAIGFPFEEYWYDLPRKIFTGPHTFTAAVIAAFGPTFVVAPVADQSHLYQSDVFLSASPVYTELGVALSYTYQPVLLPDTGAMAQSAMIETTIMCDLPSGAQMTIVAEDEQSQVLNQITLTSVAPQAAVWGLFTWGAQNWGSIAGVAQRRIAWTEPLVFKQIAIQANGVSQNGIRIGNLYLKYEKLGYLIAGDL